MITVLWNLFVTADVQRDIIHKSALSGLLDTMIQIMLIIALLDATVC
jgi:hypothetical protein